MSIYFKNSLQTQNIQVSRKGRIIFKAWHRCVSTVPSDVTFLQKEGPGGPQGFFSLVCCKTMTALLCLSIWWNGNAKGKESKIS